MGSALSYIFVSTKADFPCVSQTFEQNSTLDGILSELIVPAVKRKEIAFREKGLVGLGLCCLIARVRPAFYGKQRDRY